MKRFVLRGCVILSACACLTCLTGANWTITYPEANEHFGKFTAIGGEGAAATGTADFFYRFRKSGTTLVMKSGVSENTGGAFVWKMDQNPDEDRLEPYNGEWPTGSASVDIYEDTSVKVTQSIIIDDV